jgi:hypothetical protein
MEMMGKKNKKKKRIYFYPSYEVLFLMSFRIACLLIDAEQ